MMVTQFINSNTNNGVKNHFVIIDSDFEQFQSYESIIAEYDRKNGVLRIGEHWNYSHTTRKHFYNWLLQCFGVIVKQSEFLKILKTGDLNGVKVIYDTNL